MMHFLCIHGCPGTGKTFLAKILIEHLVIMFGHKAVVPFSHNNDKADLICGITFHSLFGFNHNTNFKDLISSDKHIKNHVSFLKLDQNKYKYERLLNAKFMIGDECSQLSAEEFEAASRIAKYIRLENTKESNCLPFGGIRLILFGDFYQLGPIAGGLLFYNEEFRNYFMVRHLLKYHRTSCEMTVQTLDAFRVGDETSIRKALNFVNNEFGKKFPLAQALFILDLILEKLLSDIKDTKKNTFTVERCKNFYSLFRNCWNGNIITMYGGEYIINPEAKFLLIKRLENVCCDTTKVYQSNSEFFYDFPTTICAENDEVDYLNEEINQRGVGTQLQEEGLHHITVVINDLKQVTRTFYKQQRVLYCNSDGLDLGVVVDISHSNDQPIPDISVMFDKKKYQIRFTYQMLSCLYPLTYYMSNKLSENDIVNDADIMVFKKQKQKSVWLRKGQRFKICYYHFYFLMQLFKLHRILSRSNAFDNPFINKSSILKFINGDSSTITLAVCGRDSGHFTVSHEYLFSDTNSCYGGKPEPSKLSPGYGATIDFYQGHEV
jgi:hypothetical protein